MMNTALSPLPTPQSQQVLSALHHFLATPLDVLLRGHPERSAEAEMLELFQRVRQQVPAYRAFLDAQGIDPEAIRTWDDFQQLPLIDKASYSHRYPLEELCKNGRLTDCDMVAVSSGSTGQPTFWPRFITDEFRIATRFEQVFHDSFQADTRKTLAVVCFALGTWVGGMFTASCCRHLAAKGYPLTVITPGNNKEEIFRVITDLGPHFDQVVLLGYPPFLKDVIDSGLARGLDWAPLNIKLVMAGEVFSEEWRTLVGERTGRCEPCFDSASLYGTADAGVLGNETPLSICIRRFLAHHPQVAAELFGESRLPTLVQYDPYSRYFEARENTLLFSGDNGIPLIRYHIADTGGVIPYETMLSFLKDHGFDPCTAPELAGRRGIRPLPFVYVFGRSAFVVSYFGANIYPENVTVGLEQPGIQEWVTGKFVLESREDANRDRALHITVELAPGLVADETRTEAIADSILAQLRRLNSEFAHYVPAEYQRPRVVLRPYGDPDHFPVGVKHRYTRPASPDQS